MARAFDHLAREAAAREAAFGSLAQKQGRQHLALSESVQRGWTWADQ